MKKQMIGMMALAALVGGCATEKQSSTRGGLRPGVLDVSPTPLPAATNPQPLAALQAPEQPAAPAAPAAFTPAAGGSSYTVQKGDTLYKIARDRYGDGKQWQKIAAANPGLSPGSLKAGQKIAIP